MSKQEHSLLSRGPGKKWSKALDTPRWVDEPVVAEPVITSPIQRPAIVNKEDKTDMDLPNLVTVVIVNFKTKNILKIAYKTFRAFYPHVPIVLVDNGSGDTSTELVRRLGDKERVRSIIIDHNVGHGPAMNKAIRSIDTPYVFTLDTDTETIKRGFLEGMIGRLREDGSYAIGWKRIVDKISGVPIEWHTDKPPSAKFIPYIHPSAGMYRVSIYHTLPPFFHHGAPCLNNMREANRRELSVVSFPIRDYVKHMKAGTRRMYDGRWNPTEKTKKKPWNAKADYPI